MTTSPTNKELAATADRLDGEWPAPLIERLRLAAQCLENADRVREALQRLVDACSYVRPIAGAVAVEASVKNIREAGKFIEAIVKARTALGEGGAL